jgi:SAM-dependent methyltransferase
MPVDYARQTVDTPNPLARFAHRRRIEVAKTAAARLAPTGGVVLDFGSGPGLLLHELGLRRRDLRLIGFEPYMEQTYPDVPLVTQLSDVPDRSIDVLTCLETCEHLEDHSLAELIAETKRLLRPGGTLLISVPIVIGPSLLPKQVNRMLLHRQALDYTPRELALAVFAGQPGPRAARRASSHKGFDFRALDRYFATELVPVGRWLSPFAKLPWWLNSQAFSTWRVSDHARQGPRNE